MFMTGPMTRARKAAMLGAGVLIAGLLAGTAAQAQGQLTVYCGVQEEWCRPMVDAFETQTGIKVSMTRKSSGEIYAQVKAEAANPTRRHLVGRHRRPAHAGGRGRPDRSNTSRRKLAELNDWAVRQWEQAKGRTVGIYSGALGFGYNTKQLAGRRASPSRNAGPTCSNPKLKDEVQVADPNSSGTAYTMLATHRADHGRGQGLRLPEGAAQEHQPVHQVGRGAGQGGEPRRDRPSASPSCTTW